jgi:hypothetical protein
MIVLVTGTARADEAPPVLRPTPLVFIAPPPVLVVVRQTRYHGHTAAEWAARYHARTRQLLSTRRRLRQRWKPTVDYALRLAHAVSGVPLAELRTVSWCESRFDPFAQNGKYLGIFQLGWAPFGLSPFDPIANALSAALTVKHDGGWRQWECSP